AVWKHREVGRNTGVPDVAVLVGGPLRRHALPRLARGLVIQSASSLTCRCRVLRVVFKLVAPAPGWKRREVGRNTGVLDVAVLVGGPLRRHALPRFARGLVVPSPGGLTCRRRLLRVAFKLVTPAPVWKRGEVWRNARILDVAVLV